MGAATPLGPPWDRMPEGAVPVPLPLSHQGEYGEGSAWLTPAIGESDAAFSKRVQAIRNGARDERLARIVPAIDPIRAFRRCLGAR